MSMPTCYSIYKYWLDKGITETGEVSDTEGVAVVEDSTLPQCWACRKPVNGLEVFSWDRFDRPVEEVWKDPHINSRLQRCHILARQFGGSDAPENLFLLCEDCHQESPDTKNRAAFFRWVYRRRQEYSYGHPVFKMVQEGVAEIKARGYDPRWFGEKLLRYSNEDMDAAVKRGLEACGLHGMHIVDSSVVVGIVDELERMVIDQQQREFTERLKEVG